MGLQYNREMSTLTKTDAQTIFDGIRRLVEALRSSSREAEKSLGISGAQLYVLQKLSVEAGSSMNELAERTLTHQSSVSVVVTRLEEKGLVVRRRAEADGRRVEIRLTSKGKRLLRVAPSPVQERILNAIKQLSPSTRTALAKGLVALNSNAGFEGKIVPLFFEGKANE